MRKILILTLCCVGCARGTIYNVWPGLSIQCAVDSSVDGDTVLVLEGVYTESVVLYGKTITIGSMYMIDGDTAHAENTIIEADVTDPDTASCFVIVNCDSGSVSLLGLTLSSGHGTLWETDDGDNQIGGNIAVFYSNIRMLHCLAIGGYAYYGSGIGFVDSRWTTDHAAEVEKCKITANRDAFFGGGAYSYYGDVEYKQCYVAYNTSVYSSAVCYIGSHLRMSECVVYGNFANFNSAVGAGGYWTEITNCMFDSNAIGDGLASQLSLSQTRGLISGCTFKRSGRAECSFFFFQIQDDTFFVNNVVEQNNDADHSTLMIVSTGGVGIGYNIFRDNVTYSGSLIRVVGVGYDRVHHNVFERNSTVVPATYGTIISDMTASSWPMDSNLFVMNSGPVIGTNRSSGPPAFAINNWWGHASGPYHAQLNPQGHGDTLAGDDVDFIPWLAEPPDTSGWFNDARPRTKPIPATWQILAVYPNPFNSSINIAIAGFTGREFELTLHNLLGQGVATIHRGPLSGQVLRFTAPASFSSGIYFLRAADRSTVVSRKVVFLK